MTVDSDLAAKYRPSPHPVDVEAALGRSMAVRALFLAPLVVAIAWLIGGSDAALLAGK